MSNRQVRDKIRNITKAVDHHEKIPERTKNIGLSIFFIISSLGILAVFGVAVTAFFYKKYTVALITIIAASGLSYLLYKIYTAEALPDD